MNNSKNYNNNFKIKLLKMQILSKKCKIKFNKYNMNYQKVKINRLLKINKLIIIKLKFLIINNLIKIQNNKFQN